MQKIKFYFFLILFLYSSCIGLDYIGEEALGNITPETLTKALEEGNNIPDTLWNGETHEYSTMCVECMLINCRKQLEEIKSILILKKLKRPKEFNEIYIIEQVCRGEVITYSHTIIALGDKECNFIKKCNNTKNQIIVGKCELNTAQFLLGKMMQLKRESEFGSMYSYSIIKIKNNQIKTNICHYVSNETVRDAQIIFGINSTECW